jgi:hypothetical protein
MRLLYAMICVLLIAWAAFGQPPKAPPVVPEKAPPVVAEPSGVVTYRYFQDSRGQWWMVPETKTAPEVAARPFPGLNFTQDTTARLVAGVSMSSQASIGTGRTITLAPGAVRRGATNCTTG